MTWQDALTSVMVVAAVAFLAKRAVSPLLKRTRGGCGTGCSGCAAHPAHGTSQPLVQLGGGSPFGPAGPGETPGMRVSGNHRSGD